MAKKSPANPFVNRGLIRHSTDFYGRDVELQHIMQRLRTMQSVSVVGERRIGKSSLLYQIALQTHQLGADITVIYTDLPDVKDEKDFYQHLCGELQVDGDTFRDLKQALEGKKVVMCLDEFERVIGQPSFPLSFFNGLRGLAQYGNLALVLATRHSLADLCLGKEVATSNFWTIFYRLNLGLFTEEDAIAFIRNRFKAAGVNVTNGEVLRLIQLSGRFPFFLEIACSHLYEMKIGNQSQWEQEFEAETREHFIYLWNKLNGEERKALRWMIELGGPIPNDNLIGDLERRGLVVQDTKSLRGYCPFSEVFEGIIHDPPPERKQSRLRRVVSWFTGAKVVLGKDPRVEAEFRNPEVKS